MSLVLISYVEVPTLLTNFLSAKNLDILNMDQAIDSVAISYSKFKICYSFVQFSFFYKKF